MTKTAVYYPKGVCSQRYEITVTDGKIEKLDVVGGCNGNLKGIAGLVEGMEVKEAIHRMEGITCGFKTTSCPDQISKALREML
ncbi:MAG: TIGR03905 family TSCPD domain-containing protein [Clostridiaceae bacterium]|nr:TIGR03905 family TSCPD domain-containing protein [Clostridiaceae bacterium]